MRAALYIHPGKLLVDLLPLQLLSQIAFVLGTVSPVMTLDGRYTSARLAVFLRSGVPLSDELVRTATNNNATLCCLDPARRRVPGKDVDQQVRGELRHYFHPLDLFD